MAEDLEREDLPTAETSSRTPEDAPTLESPGTDTGAGGPGLPLSEGEVLAERYWILRLLGRGGMGEVWQAHDLKLRVEVALKSLHPRFYADERRRELLRQEVRSAREVISPNVCRVYDLVEVDGRELLSMEHIDGHTLLSLLKERAPLPLTEARDLALQFLTGLDAVHAAGLVHRDFKPENVMITRSGRVVVMDFGIAQKQESETGSVSGTPAYMSPEQARGEAVDARTDLYAVGVVLAEMVSEAGVRDRTSRKSVWEALREDPPRVPDSPWSAVIRKAVAAEPAERPESAQALIRSLQEITLRVEGAEERHPYPGLASFTEADAGHFFGREPEVEAMARRLARAHLLALAGPSGAGKSSFLRAGLIPALPDGWGHAFCTPGDQPFASLGRALRAALSEEGTAEGLEDPESLLERARTWRKDHEEALVILDQFEELFTLNPPEVQRSFAGLVGRLVDADVRVLVSMRDDFLFHCQAHDPLLPLFSELMPLGPPTGAALGRALVQPALSLGYRFEDDSLVSEMLEEVSRERGALPLLAFAAAGLWERRDADEGLLTRRAYEEIGGVGGALARHAEETLETVGLEREGIVRELFRNLVTARGTRVARDHDELLSVFEDTAAAEEVLATLVGARLLTTFELTERETGATTQRVEVIHESLLSAWPRLVHWRTQDAEGAQLRDQLRQAARLWDERGRPEELLWTGASYLEYRAWRERYPGGLTDTEARFAEAMAELAGRRRRRRRALTGAVIAALVAALALFGFLWRQARDEARRAEASKLLALGQLELERYPSAAVAYAVASLERYDDPTARRFVTEALWRGPTQIQVTKSKGWAARFTPDGEWIKRVSLDGPQELWPRSGAAPRTLPRAGAWAAVPGHLLSWNPKEGVVGVWSLPGLERVADLPLPDGERPQSWDGERVYSAALVERDGERMLLELRSRALDGGPPTIHGRLWATRGVQIDPTRRWAVYNDGEDILAAPLQDLAPGNRRRLGRVEGWAAADPPTPPVFSADGQRVAVGNPATGRVDIWSLADEPAPPRVVEGGAGLMSLDFSPDGSRVVTAGLDQLVRIADLDGPPDADSLILRQGAIGQQNSASYHPDGHWLVTCAPDSLSIWPLTREYPRVLRGHSQGVRSVAFTPDGRFLVTAGDLTLRSWPLNASAGDGVRVLGQGQEFQEVVVDPHGRFVVATSNDGPVTLAPLDHGPTRVLANGFAGQTWNLAIGPEGRRVAVEAGVLNREERHLVRVWDLESGEVRTLDRGLLADFPGSLQLTRDGKLVYEAADGLRLADPESGDSRLLAKDVAGFVLHREGHVVLARLASGAALLRVDLGTGATTTLPFSVPSDTFQTMAIDPTGTILVTGHTDGAVHVTPVGGGPSHLLLGHRGTVMAVAVSPDGRWIASSGEDKTVRLWPMPEGTPFHTLPRDELLARLRALTNLRAVLDEESPTGYRIDADPFPGWETLPSW